MIAGPLVEQTTRYTVVGAICAAVQNAVMIAGGLAGGHYVPLAVLAYAIATPLGYLLHCQFTFRVAPALPGFVRFASGVAAGFPVYFLVMAALCSGLHLPVAAAAPIATVALYLWNYASAHWAVRRRLPLG